MFILRSRPKAQAPGSHCLLISSKGSPGPCLGRPAGRGGAKKGKTFVCIMRLFGQAEPRVGVRLPQALQLHGKAVCPEVRAGTAGEPQKLRPHSPRAGSAGGQGSHDHSPTHPDTFPEREALGRAEMHFKSACKTHTQSLAPSLCSFSKRTAGNTSVLLRVPTGASCTRSSFCCTQGHAGTLWPAVCTQEGSGGRWGMPGGWVPSAVVAVLSRSGRSQKGRPTETARGERRLSVPKTQPGPEPGQAESGRSCAALPSFLLPRPAPSSPGLP